MPDQSLKPMQSLTLAEAQRKIMDLMAISDRSVKQITDKLSPVTEPEILVKALDWMSQQSWNPSPEKLQTHVIENLNRKNKGQTAINERLKNLGLDTVQIEPQIELEKALQAVENKFNKSETTAMNFKSAQKEKLRMLRFLSGRGFDETVADQVLHIYFKNTIDEDIYDEEF
jgi:SOS response regulatory protein OraA/RecX